MAASFVKISIALALVHCTLQGVLVPLIVKLFSSSEAKNKWFIAYVLCVNLIALAQTVLRVVQGFQALTSPPALLALPFFTVLISSSVQAFFLFRCWNIFQRRLLPFVPYFVLWLAGLTIGLITSSCLSGALGGPLTSLAQSTFTAWMICWFLLDLMITVTTVAYLYRCKTGLGEHYGVFSVVWQVIWASAAPPLLLMLLTIVGKFMNGDQGFAIEQLGIGISEKFFALALMITIVGRGHIRKSFDRPTARPSWPGMPSHRSVQISGPAHAGGSSGSYELRTPTKSMTLPASSFTRAPSEIDLEEQDNHSSKIQAL